jgi:hypothetical protein
MSTHGHSDGIDSRDVGEYLDVHLKQRVPYEPSCAYARGFISAIKMIQHDILVNKNKKI